MFAAAMSHARRQQYRHLTRSAGYAVAAAAILVVALSVSSSGGEAPIVFMLFLLAAGVSRAARRSKRLAGRWRVGADSEQAVRFALSGLSRRGWMVRNDVLWSGGGDVDHLVRSPNGLGFAIETKTLTFSQEHVRRTGATARWAAQRRRRYPHGVIPVLCVVEARDVESRFGDVLVVSLDRLLPVLERLAMSTRHPGRSAEGRGWTKRQVRRGARVRLHPTRSVAGDG
jgi:Nuclease-related domain